MEMESFPYYVNWHMAAHFANTLSVFKENRMLLLFGSGTSVTCSGDGSKFSGYSLPTEHGGKLQHEVEQPQSFGQEREVI